MQVGNIQMTSKMNCFYKLHEKVEENIGKLFERYGRFVSRHPWKVIIFMGVLNSSLGLGLLRLKSDSGIMQYVPTGSQASKDETMVKSIFKLNTTENFFVQSLPDLGFFGEVIVELKQHENILNHSYWAELREIVELIQNITVKDSDGRVKNYTDLCAKSCTRCAVDGGFLLSSSFVTDMSNGAISYPFYDLSNGETILIDRFIGGFSFLNGSIQTAKALKLRFNLNDNSSKLSRKWEEKFVETLKSYKGNSLTVKYSYSDSLSVELSDNVSGDITFFSVTITLMIVFASLALLGTNCVDNRYNLGLAGILSTCLSILAAFGLVSLCGAVFVDIVGIMPFLILGVGVDDMFILLSGLAHTSCQEDVETRIGRTMRTSGIAITVTSITDIVAFCAGAASVFPSVRNFSWYTGAAVLFCYLNYVTFYIGVMTINEKRVTEHRHWLTCCVTKSKRDIKAAENSSVNVLLCGGSPRQTREDVEGPIEKYPKKLLKKIVLNKCSKVVIIILFLCYLGVSIWGAYNFKEGLDLRNLVSPDSYHYKFYDTNVKLFDQRIFISLNIQSKLNYVDSANVHKIESLLSLVKADKNVQSNYELSWLASYAQSGLYDNSSNANFIEGLMLFLSMPQGKIFDNDVVFSSNNDSIVASRFHVQSTNLIESTEQANLMVRIRNLADGSQLPVFAFSSSFIFYEQYVQIVPQTIQTLGIAVSVVFLVTAVFMPLPTLVFLVTISVSMIMVGVIGFMKIVDLTLSSITMIHIVMCVGFSVDFGTHICHAFMMLKENTRDERVESALDLAGGPILNGALSSVIGIIMLAFSTSYIFFSFFKVMFIVVVVGAMHALFLLPVLLSLIGPLYGSPPNKYSDKSSENVGGNESGDKSSDIEMFYTISYMYV